MSTMGLMRALSHLLFATVLLNLILLRIQVNARSDEGSKSEWYWQLINSLALNSQTVFPDMGNESSYGFGSENIAIESTGFDWRDRELSEHGKFGGECFEFSGETCAIKGYFDPQNLHAIEPKYINEEREGTILMKLVGGRGYFINGTSKRSSIFAMEHVDVPLSKWDALSLLKKKQFFINKTGISVVAEALYDVRNFHLKPPKSYLGNDEVLHTAPLSFNEKQPLTNGPCFSVSDAILHTSFNVVFKKIKNAKNELLEDTIVGEEDEEEGSDDEEEEEDKEEEETFRAAYLTPIETIDSSFQEHTATYIFPSQQQWSLLAENFKRPEVNTSALFLHCIGELNDYCHDIIEYLRSFKSVKVTFVITDRMEKWLKGFSKNDMTVILIEYEVEKMISSPFLNFIQNAGSEFQWKMTMTEKWYPNPQIKKAPDSGLSIKPDFLVIGGPFFGPILSGTSSPPTLIPSSAALANARFAGMLADFIVMRRSHMRLRSHIFASVPRPTRFEDILDRARNTATPYIYDESQLPESLLNTPFGLENIKLSKFAMPVKWQGAGLVNLERMLHTKVHVSPSYVDLGYSIPGDTKGVKRVIVKLDNTGPLEVGYEFEHVRAVALTSKGDGTPLNLIGSESVNHISLYVNLESMSPLNYEDKIIRIPAHGTVSVVFSFTFHIFRKFNSPFIFCSGYLKFKQVYVEDSLKYQPASANYGTLHVPYLEMYGDENQYTLLEKENSLISMTEVEILPYDSEKTNDRKYFGPIWNFKLKFPMSKAKLYLHKVNAEGEDTRIGQIYEYRNVIFDDVQMAFPTYSTGQAIGWKGFYTPLGSDEKQKVPLGKFKFCLEGNLGVESNDLTTETYQTRMACSPSFLTDRLQG